MSDVTDELLTLDEAARELKVSKEQVRKLTQLGRLPYVPVGTGQQRIVRRIRRGALTTFKRQEQHAEDARLVAYANAATGARKRPRWEDHY